MNRLLVLVIVCVLAMTVTATSAFAQGPAAREGYDESGLLQGLDTGSPPSQPQAAQAEAPAPVETAVEALPFTGLDAAIVALMGIALLGSGFAVRRVALNQ